MRVYDMHIHNFGTPDDCATTLKSLESAGVYGGCIFSDWPDKKDFKTRLEEVLACTDGVRTFPVMWIHPYEQNIMENIGYAVGRGIAAFKMICTDYYVYEDKVLEVIKKIASLGKPIIFHSGILWDGEVSSKYNRPLNFEALLDIDGLKFSMGHCSWPWIDECIALYGKFLNALQNGKTAEMFFDITPGTPKIYRDELLTKLYTIGYDVGDNVLFGTDSVANEYRPEWTKSWLATDKEILDRLGVSLENRQKLYEHNLMRFLGKTEINIAHNSPSCDDANEWSAQNSEVKAIIRKWYKRLGFDKSYDREFEKALAGIPISDAITLDEYDENCQDGARNLLSFLYFCESTEKRYKELGIDSKILDDTLCDLVIWTDIWSEIKGRMYLGELSWLKRHLGARLFRLGRLQFCMADGELEIHIPSIGPLDIAECEKSIAAAREFFKTHFADFKYDKFTCHSWLLDSTLKQFLDKNSNIIKFQSLFDITKEDESYALLGYIFRWDTNIRNLKNAVCSSSFATKIKKYALGGGKFHESLGIIKR